MISLFITKKELFGLLAIFGKCSRSTTDLEIYLKLQKYFPNYSSIKYRMGEEFDSTGIKYIRHIEPFSINKYLDKI